MNYYQFCRPFFAWNPITKTLVVIICYSFAVAKLIVDCCKYCNVIVARANVDLENKICFQGRSQKKTLNYKKLNKCINHIPNITQIGRQLFECILLLCKLC